jgi:hypothetical protein
LVAWRFSFPVSVGLAEHKARRDRYAEFIREFAEVRREFGMLFARLLNPLVTD